MPWGGGRNLRVGGCFLKFPNFVWYSGTDPLLYQTEPGVFSAFSVPSSSSPWCMELPTEELPMARLPNAVDASKFDMDKGCATDLSLDVNMYDTSPSASYQSWMLLELDQPMLEE